MISSNCTFKLLDKVHIGVRVRMTSDKNTLPFNNEPLSNVKIVDYNQMGFKISHEKLPKIIWVDFKQLPLTNLTIINGVIQDEITFVENILSHEMEFIKTDTLDYIELVHIKKNEKADQFSSITSIKPGELVKSALCNGGKDMIFLGIFYTKKIERTKLYERNSYYKYSYNYFLSRNSPQRAVFLVKNNSISLKEDFSLALNHDFFEYSDRYDEKYKNQFREKEKTYDKYIDNFVKESSLDRFNIVEFPVTSKQIKKVIKLNKSDDRFSDIENNSQLVINGLNSYFYGMNKYRSESLTKQNLVKLNKELDLNFDANSFVIVNSRLSEDINYANASKKNLDEKAVEFIRSNYTVKLENTIYNTENE